MTNSSKRIRRQAAAWEKIFAKHTSDRRLVSIIKNSQNSIKNDPNDLIRTQTKSLDRCFTREDLCMANKHTKREMFDIISH